MTTLQSNTRQLAIFNIFVYGGIRKLASNVCFANILNDKTTAAVQASFFNS